MTSSVFRYLPDETKKVKQVKFSHFSLEFSKGFMKAVNELINKNKLLYRYS